MNKNTTFIVTAAGGNGTAIQILDSPLSRADYVERGKRIGKEMESLGAEQAGFLILADRHFELAGGEFCGNGARSAAVVLSRMLKKSEVSFTISGYAGVVEGRVKMADSGACFAECVFPGMPTKCSKVLLPDDMGASVVDLGGIVHVVIEAPFPEDPETYKKEHGILMRSLGLEDRSAVGVLWIERVEGVARMNPVVWVRDVQTFFYESSCGSGTMAVGIATGVSSVIQPTGQIIEVGITPDAVILRSDMEVFYGN